MSVEKFKPQETQRRTVCLLKKAQAVYNSAQQRTQKVFFTATVSALENSKF